VQHAHHEMKKKDGEIAEVIQDWLGRFTGSV
jgi:hypothetical protein